jgi:hypothetical protein
MEIPNGLRPPLRLARVQDQPVRVGSRTGRGLKPSAPCSPLRIIAQLSHGARLSYLGPEIVRALLVGSQSNALTPSRLLRLSKNLPHDWKEQRCFLGFAA